MVSERKASPLKTAVRIDTKGSDIRIALMSWWLHGADGDCQRIIEIVEGDFFGCEFSSDQTVKKGGGDKHIAEASDRNISGTKHI